VHDDRGVLQLLGEVEGALAPVDRLVVPLVVERHRADVAVRERQLRPGRKALEQPARLVVGR
jgi:hypothetical protein